MRCNNCRKKIDNPNLIRCPHCGRALKKRKKRAPAQTALSISFIAVMVAFIVFAFLSFFFNCDYYSIPAMIISAIVISVAIPFIYGNYENITSRAVCFIAAATSVPLIANWVIIFFFSEGSLDRGGAFSAYYIIMLAIPVVCDVILILRANGVIKQGRVVSLFVLALGFAAAGYSIYFYAGQRLIKAFAIVIIAVEVFVLPYITFYVLNREGSRG